MKYARCLLYVRELWIEFAFVVKSSAEKCSYALYVAIKVPEMKIWEDFFKMLVESIFKFTLLCLGTFAEKWADIS